jgi:hypothetical protein
VEAIIVAFLSRLVVTIFPRVVKWSTCMNSGSPRLSLSGALPFIGILIVGLAVVLRCRVFPTVDGPIHVYYAEVVRNLLLHTGSYSSYFYLKHVFPPYAFHTYLLIFLNGLFVPLLSEKLLVCVYIIIFCFGFRYLVQSLHAREELAPLLAFAFVFNHMLYMGFYNFSFSTAISLWAVGFWIRNSMRFTMRRSAVFFGLIFLLLVTHPVGLMISYVFFGVHIAILGLQIACTTPGPLADRFARMVSTLRRPVLHILLSAPVFLWIAQFTTVQKVNPPDLAPLSIAKRIYSLLTLAWSSPIQSWSYRAVLLVIFAIGLLLALLQLYRTGAAAWKSGAASLAITGLLCAAVFIVAPEEMNGSGHFPERFAIFAAMFVLACSSGFPLGGRLKTAALIVIVVAACLNLVSLDRLNRTIIAELSPFLDTPPVGSGQLLALTAETDGPIHGLSFDPLFWAGAIYARRSEAILLNSPWVELPIMMLAPIAPPECANRNPGPMATCLAENIGRPAAPKLGLLIDEAMDPSNPLSARVAAAYGLHASSQANATVAFYGAD